jgi:hypothetical protein
MALVNWNYPERTAFFIDDGQQISYGQLHMDVSEYKKFFFQKNLYLLLEIMTLQQ